MTPPQRFAIRVGGDDAVTTATVADGQVRVDGTDSPFTVMKASDGCYLVSDGDHTWRVYVTGPPASRRVFVDGAVADVEVMSERAPRRRPRTSHGDLTAAPMHATVLQVLVEVGQTVSLGQVVLKLEAMKMELPIRAPRAGTVTALHCRAGELVQPGVSLIDIA
jgi:3-methylcrotonyl-CoA carboxylase alpha subunit